MPFPTNSTVLDDFNRANGAIGSNWTANFLGFGDDTPNVESNVIRTPSGGVGWCDAYLNTITPGPDFEVYGQITTKPGNDQELNLHGGVLSPGSSAADGYVVRLITRSGTDDLYLMRYTNASFTQIATAAVEFTAGWWLGLERIGTTIRGLYYNGSAWVQFASVTDATHTGAGRLGFDMEGVTSRLDNFSGGTVVVAGGTIDELASQWREDDGSESGASDIGSPGDALVRPVLSPVRARIQLNATGNPVAVTPLKEYRIKRASKADPWRTVRR